MTAGVAIIGRAIPDEPVVLIAAHGDHFHQPRAQRVLNLEDGTASARPACGVDASGELAARWVFVDRLFATMLDRTPCARCYPHH